MNSNPSKMSREIPRKPGPLLGLGGMLMANLVTGWMSTMDHRVVHYDRSIVPRRGLQQPRIYIFWHENILCPLYLAGHCHLAMLLSQHRDADILARIAYHLGFDCIRGSSNRGSLKALREMVRSRGQMHLTMTPDGPRGPRRKMAPGPVYLASKLQMPLVPLGFGYHRPWRARSWDRFAIPKPFSRSRSVIGPPIWIPSDLDRAGRETARRRLERLLTDLTLEAEAWAEAGTRKAGEEVLRPQAAPRRQPKLTPPPSIVAILDQDLPNRRAA